MASFAEIQEELANMLAIPDEELTPEQRKEMELYLAELRQAGADKIDAFAGFLKVQVGYAEACKAESQRLAAKAKAIETRLDWLKGQYLSVMLSHGIKQIKGQAYSLTVRESEKVQAPENETFLMALYNVHPDLVRHKESWEPNKTAIKDALKAGQVLPGCELVKSPSLQIR